MDAERKKLFIINAMYYATLIVLVLLFIRYLLSPLSPFIAGFIVAWLLHRPAHALARKLHLHRRVPIFILGIVFYVIVFVLVLMAAVQVISALEHFIPQIPVIYTGSLLPFIRGAFEQLEGQMAEFDPEIVDIVDRMAKELFSFLEQLISGLSVSAVRLASTIITGLPNVILTIILTVVSTFFISLDFDKVVGFLKSCLPIKMQNTISETVTTGVSSIRKILVSYIAIMFLSFVELSIGFLLMRIPYAVGFALLVAVIDIMPILGTGLVLIPWAIIAAILGNYPMALGVALLYIIMLVVRNIVEPKLVGQQMGLHPLATLVSMFVGLQRFGLFGLLGFPIALSLYFKLRKTNAQQKAAAAQDSN